MNVDLVIDNLPVRVSAGSTIRSAAAEHAIEIPTICWAAHLTPANACRLCVVEVEGSAALVPACSRVVEDGMVVHTQSDRVRHSRRMVLELLAASADLAWAEPELRARFDEYGATLDRFESEGHTPRADDESTAPKRHDDLYVRDYERCILCYRCVDACGDDAQHTFAIAVAGRGHGAHISTEYDRRLPESACVYCGNCIAVCPTGALTAVTEYELRLRGEWRPESQTVTRTVCAFCGVGCNLDLHVQDAEIVKVTSPADHDISLGNLCIKGRFGWQHLT